MRVKMTEDEGGGWDEAEVGVRLRVGGEGEG